MATAVQNKNAWVTFHDNESWVCSDAVSLPDHARRAYRLLVDLHNSLYGEYRSLCVEDDVINWFDAYPRTRQECARKIAEELGDALVIEKHDGEGNVAYLIPVGSARYLVMREGPKMSL